MMKGLFFTVALLAPGFAYGGNPSGDLSVEVVPASPKGIACDMGPAYTGAVPAAAQAAGFTHCAANYDFANSFYATRSNWLDCAGAANPQFWNLPYVRNPAAPCSDYNIIFDSAFGTNVLQSTYTPADWSAGVFSTELDSTNSPSPTYGTNPGFFFASQFYVEVVQYVTANTQNNAYNVPNCGAPNIPGIFGVWTWATPITVETDYMEFYPGANKCINGGNTYDHSNSGSVFPGNERGQVGQQGGYDPTVPHTYGILQTASGTIFTRRNYLDGSALGTGSDSATFSTGAITTHSWTKITIGPENLTAPQPAVNVDHRLQRITVWECPTYVSAGHC
jgi:hypothetical protein